METNAYPIARSWAMIFGRPATVSERSPPPSCISTTAPGVAAPTTLFTIACTPGRLQSLGSTE
jgi:hypothetical protein